MKNYFVLLAWNHWRTTITSNAEILHLERQVGRGLEVTNMPYLNVLSHGDKMFNTSCEGERSSSEGWLLLYCKKTDK